MNNDQTRRTRPASVRGLRRTRLLVAGLAFVGAAAAAAPSVRDQVQEASRSGAANLALDLATEHRALFTPLEYAQLQHAAIAQRLRWSRAETWNLTGPERFATLDAALADGWQLLDSLPLAPEYASLRTAVISDMIYGLGLRGRYADAIKLYEGLRATNTPVHPYVLVSAGNAYAYEERYDEAIVCYEEALAKAGPGDIDRVPTQESLFFAYMDRGRYEDAEQLLQRIEKTSSQYVENAPVAERPNEDYATAQRLRAQYLMYSGETEAGTLAIDALQHDAPFSSGLRNAAASARLGDARPREAKAAFTTALAERPDDIQAMTGLARASMALREYPEAEAIVTTLSERFPESSSVRNLQRDYEVYQSPLLTMDFGGDIGHGGDNSNNDNSTIANREWSLNTMLYTSPISHNYRLFFHQFTGYADLGDGHKSRVRNGAGLEYRRGSIEASTELHQSTGPSGRFGASANVAWLPSDGWRLAANFDSDSNDLPWKAYRAGIHGWSSGVSARYQPTERTYYDVAYQLQHYSDSNTRQTIGATWFQNLWTVPRHSVSTWTSVAYSNNSKTDTECFSPDHDLTAQVTAMYEWRPWRDGQYAFRQRVYATGGVYNQAEHGNSALWQLRLEQVWDLPRQTSITYGVGYGRHSYDGDPENRTLFYLTLNIPF